MTENTIAHIALVLDASSSMQSLSRKLIEIADEQIAYLAEQSKDLNMETRVSVYTFADTVTCRIFDKDVLRLPSMKDLYLASGMTALIDATLKSQEDLALTCQLYGEHSFLTFVVTDGVENRSRMSAATLRDHLNNIKPNWTVAVLVPDQRSKHTAQQYGFPADNIAIWDATSTVGLEKAGSVIREATDAYMTTLASGTGFRGTKSIFTMNSTTLNKATVSQAGLTPLHGGAYLMIPVVPEAGSTGPIVIKPFIDSLGHRFQIGKNFYELTKPEKVGLNKQIAILEKKTGKVFVGADARAVVGLPDTDVRVRPDYNPEFTVFIQSSSNNRHLMPHTKLLILN